MEPEEKLESVTKLKTEGNELFKVRRNVVIIFSRKL
jgi:hypothetical protein